MKASESNNTKQRSTITPSTGSARRDHAPIDGVMNETTLEKLIQRSEAVTETLRHILYFTLPPPPKVRK